MIDDPLMFRLRPNEESFALKMIRTSQVRDFFDSQQGEPPRWEYVTQDKIRKLIEELKETPQCADKEEIETRAFLWAVRALLVGDTQHKYWVERLSKRGIRNLRPKVEFVERYLVAAFTTEDLEKYSPELALKVRKRIKLTDKEVGEYKRIVMQFVDVYHQAMAPVKAELGFPPTTPETYAYSISEEVIKSASDGCRNYLQRMLPYGVLTYPLYSKVQQDLCRDFPDEAEAILAKIKRTATRDHLSAISVESKEGQLVVSIVNVRSQLLTMEGWKFLELIKNHGEPISLGDLDRKGNWEAEPILTFSNNRAGELIAVYTANDSTIRVVCQREQNNKNGTKYAPDKAAFVLDQDYLLCLYIAILQLKNNKIRFDELREKAVTKAAPNLKELFDPGLFEG